MPVPERQVHPERRIADALHKTFNDVYPRREDVRSLDEATESYRTYRTTIDGRELRIIIVVAQTGLPA